MKCIVTLISELRANILHACWKREERGRGRIYNYAALHEFFGFDLFYGSLRCMIYLNKKEEYLFLVFLRCIILWRFAAYKTRVRWKGLYRLFLGIGLLHCTLDQGFRFCSFLFEEKTKMKLRDEKILSSFPFLGRWNSGTCESKCSSLFLFLVFPFQE